MIGFLKRLFAGPRAESDDAVVEERYETFFDKAGRVRFLEEADPRYSVSIHPGELRIQLRSPRILAWAENPVHRYRDAVIECDFLFRRGEGAAPSSGPAAEPASANVTVAAGLLFRYADRDNFYRVMVGDSGHLRFDVVFNGRPRGLVAWTETGSDTSNGFSLRVLSRGTRFTLLVNERWVAEAEDDGLDLGWTALAAENFGLPGGFEAVCADFSVESRPMEVEALHSQFDSPAFIGRAARLALAETFLSMGQALQAAVQIEKIASDGTPLGPRERFVRAEAELRLGLLAEAEADVAAVLEAEPSHERAGAEMADILYLRGRYLELRNWVESGRAGKGALASNLLGHARHNLGEFAAAAQAYAEAARLDPSQPIYELNAARSLDSLGDAAAAVEAYLRAAQALLSADDLDDLSLVMGRLAELAPGDGRPAAIEAKLLFREGRRAEAESRLDAIIARGEADASIIYLSALCKNQRGRRTEAIALLDRAVELEPAYPLYRFRLAESLAMAGRDYGPELDEALAHAPQDGWILNLASQRALETGDPGLAREYAERAMAALPGEVEPVISLSQILFSGGDAAKALELLGPWDRSPRALNQAANVLCAEGRLEEGLARYGQALALKPDEAEILVNRAACLIELDRFSEAESNLRAALDLGPGGRAYILMGRIAEIYGEYPRAEVAFRQALEESPSDARVLAELAELYLSTLRFPKAEPLIASLEALGSPRAAPLRERLTSLAFERLSCASCARTWLAPRGLPPQGSLKLRGELPDDSPAGACPSCGKVFCVGCRKDDLVEDRLVCPDCRTPLRLSDDRLKHLAMKASGI